MTDGTYTNSIDGMTYGTYTKKEYEDMTGGPSTWSWPSAGPSTRWNVGCQAWATGQMYAVKDVSPDNIGKLI